MSNPYLAANGTLLNKFGISDKALLAQVEYGLTTQRAYALQDTPLPGSFDLAHLKSIHKNLFADIYDWAGQEREINISKRSAQDQNWKGVFTDRQHVASEAADIHARTASQNYLQGLSKEQFAQALAPIFADWNRLHPFPEGNGRSLQTMMAQLATNAGHSLDFYKVDADRFREAMASTMRQVLIANPTQTREPNYAQLVQILREIDTQEQTLRLEPIRLNHYPQLDRQAAQVDTVNAVQSDPQKFIDKYRADPRSLQGRYVAADLIKETFDLFIASKESRDRYNGPLHNSAAVLASEVFRQNLQDRPTDGRDQVVFVTGIPGAGKTTTLISGETMRDNYAMIYEGQLSNPVTTFEKIQLVLDSGFKPVIVAVHITPEAALENTMRRFNDEGRGASISVMANIQGNLADSLAKVYERFGNQVDLNILDKRNPSNHLPLDGWNHLDVLRSEGNHEQITERLTQHLWLLRDTGTLSSEAVRQATNARLSDAPRTLDSTDGRSIESAHSRPGIPERDR